MRTNHEAELGGGPLNLSLEWWRRDRLIALRPSDDVLPLLLGCPVCDRRQRAWEAMNQNERVEHPNRRNTYVYALVCRMRIS